MPVIIGLGNPGEQYKNTRHNAGYLALDFLTSKIAATTGSRVNFETNKKLNSLIYRNGDYIFVKPLTFMNESGRAAQAVLSYYNLLPKKFGFLKTKNSDLSAELIVIQDEMDLPLGQMKVSSNSRSAGHRGIESIINYLKTQNFTRIRIGINSETRGQIPTEKFVLQKFNETELKILNEVLTKIKI